jgi:predicted MFS family arabinose efflux permease
LIYNASVAQKPDLISMNSLERRSTFALSSIFALRMLGLFMIIPVFAIVGQQYQGATPALLGLAVGIYGLAQAIFQIPFSLWADRFSRRRLIIIGLALFAIGGAIAAMSTSIYGVIVGRAIAGSGAVSAVVMALLSDVTREEQRSKAMAFMGMSIGLSFVVAFCVGPVMTAKLGIAGLFWLTTVMGLVAMLMLLLVPKVNRHYRAAPQGYLGQLKQVLRMGDLNRLHVSIFMLHLLFTAMFIFLPSQLIHYAGIPLAQHTWVYLPLLLLSLLVSFPSIILAEKYRKMRGIFMAAIATITLGLLLMAVDYANKHILLVGLGLFFVAFNVLEALLPSWLSKAAPIQSKSTAMGVNSSAQFLGAFCGGSLGGQLLGWHHPSASWALLAILAGIWLLITLSLKQPRYLSSIVVTLPDTKEINEWTSVLLAIQGIEEVVVMSEKQVAYLKLDKQRLDAASRQQLSQLIKQPLAI